MKPRKPRKPSRKAPRKPAQGHGPIVTPWTPPKAPEKPIGPEMGERMLRALGRALKSGAITKEDHELGAARIAARIRAWCRR